ncbi:Integrator complex subunit 2 [Linderina macrospora]|uniref:Integrator complex subunit 2 n=1 Tax=Linderina macrospora TaxID=4868 RepID=A0ACC1JHH9_9FUNG|nr:Integrator complex subunit 2 [Linderina macrospora]
MSGSARRRLRLVLVQLHELTDRTPTIYRILEHKQLVENSAASLSRLERQLNAAWKDLKLRCSLLIFERAVVQETVLQSPLVEDCPPAGDKLVYVQSLVVSVLQEAIENTVAIWESFATCVRSLVLAGQGAEALKCIAHLSKDCAEVQQDLASTLLSVYRVLPDVYKVVIKDSVEYMASLGPANARIVAHELRRHRVLAGVMFRTLASQLNTTSATDVRRFLDGLLTTGVTQWIGKAKCSKIGSSIRDAVYKQFNALAPEEQQLHVSSYIRVVSGLIGFLRLEALSADFGFFQRVAQLTNTGHEARLCAAMLLTLVGFGAQMTARDTLDAITATANTPAGQQVDCLLAHLTTEHAEDVERFAMDTLGMDFVFPRDRLFYLKEVMQQSDSLHFADASIARRLVRIPRPAQPPSSDAATATASASCSTLHHSAVLYCLQGNVFQDQGVDVREWITHMVRTADMTNAGLLGPLVKSYVNGIFSSAAITPIPEAMLQRGFAAESVAGDRTASVPPAMALYLLYILYYNEHLLDQPKQSTNAFASLPKRPVSAVGNLSASGSVAHNGQLRYISSGTTPGSWGSSSRNSPIPGTHPGTRRTTPLGNVTGVARRGEYSDQLFDSLPVAWILQTASNSADYQLIWPDIVSMATAQFPDQVEPVSVLQRELAVNAIRHSDSAPCASRQLSHSDFVRLATVARAMIRHLLEPRLDAMQTQHLIQFADKYTSLPEAVRMETAEQLSSTVCVLAVRYPQDKELTAVVRRIWYMAHTLNPHAVSTATVNAWRSKSEMAKPKFITQDLWLDPLVLFRLNPSIFQSANLADVFLTILSEFLLLSKASMRRLYRLRQKDTGALKQSHLTAMLQLQDSGALQLLLELTSFIKDVDVKRVVFGFVHARFLEQRAIQKLLHFQAYDIATIPDMVEHVPSMHACSEFIPELLMHPSMRLQHFAIKLAAAITTKYPIVANEGMAKEVILPHVQTTLAQIIGSAAAEQLVMANAMVNAVMAICQAYPNIAEECKKLFVSLREQAEERARPLLPTSQNSASPPPQYSDSLTAVARWVKTIDSAIQCFDSTNTLTSKVPRLCIEEADPSDTISRLLSKSRADNKAQQPGRNGSPEPRSSQGGGSSQQGGSQQMYRDDDHRHSHHHQSSGPQKRPHGQVSGREGRGNGLPPRGPPPVPPLDGFPNGASMMGGMPPGMALPHMMDQGPQPGHRDGRDGNKGQFHQRNSNKKTPRNRHNNRAGGNSSPGRDSGKQQGGVKRGRNGNDRSRSRDR